MSYEWLVERGRLPKSPAPMKTGAIIYIRVSTRGQIDNGSLETQREACIKHCEDQGYRIFDIVEDAGFSGAVGSRPGVERMIQLCREHSDEIGFVVANVMDRASRNTEQWIEFRRFIATHDIILKSASEGISTATAEGTAEADYKVAFAAMERVKILSRTKAGTKKARGNGCPTYPAPLGLVNHKIKGIGATFLHEEPTSMVIKEMYEILDGGGTLENASVHAAARGVVSKRGRPLDPKSIRRLLLNPVYAGYIPASDGLGFVKGNYEAIIEDGVFERVARKLTGCSDGLGQRHLKSNPQYPLGQVLRCPVCGAPCSGYSVKGHHYYKCPRRGCCYNIRAGEVEDAFAGLLDRVTLAPQYAAIAPSMTDDVVKEAHHRLARCHRSIIDRIVRITTSQEEILKHHNVGSITMGSAASLMAKLERDLEAERNMLRYMDLLIPDGDPLTEEIVTALEHPGAIWPEVPVHARRDFARMIFPDGLVFDRVSGFNCKEAGILPIFCIA